MSRVRDHLQKARRKLDKHSRAWLTMSVHWTAAQADRLVGRNEAALLHYAYLVRHVQTARESLRSYRALDRIARRDPALSRYRPGPEMPEGLLVFVGYARSGHSLVGSLLDAHPDIVVSHELDALRHLQRGADYAEVVEAIKLNSLVHHELGRGATGYDYVVPGQSQGSYRRLRLLGDKKGNGAVRIIRRHPDILDRLEREVPVPVHFLHVVRNPFDNIATKALRRRTSLGYAARGYFANVEAVAALKARYGERVIDLYLDDLIARPQATLRGLLERLGIESVDEAYLEACASIMFGKPRRTSAQAEWAPDLVRSIGTRMAAYPFLARYCADAPEASEPSASALAG